MQFVAQASHELVPPDVLEPVLRALVNNFVTERNSSDAMAMGLNAIRELCSRAPLVMNQDLLQDLVQYKNYREKSVMMAARALLHLYRVNLPTLLHKRDRGRPTEASIELKVKQYGEIDAKDYVPGAEALVSGDKGKKKGKEPVEPEEDSDSDSGSWVDISDNEGDFEIETDSDEDESEDEEMEEEEDEEDEESSDEEEETCSDEEIDQTRTDNDESKSELDDSRVRIENEGSEKSAANGKQGASKSKAKKSKLQKEQEKAKKKTESTVNKEAIIQHRKEMAEEISCTRILTDEDFERIENAQAKKMKTGFKALQLGKKRKHNVALEQEEAKGELVDLGDIENIYKKKKHDKATRLESVLKGREGREKWGYNKNRTNPHASTTNQEKKKDKNFMMVRHKVRGKIKRSFKDKQIALRNHLVKQRRMK
ncbi:hypothetical protein WDU94_015567 [Cyamophila willieti]